MVSPEVPQMMVAASDVPQIIVAPCGSWIGVPHAIDGSAVQPATAPYITDLGSGAPADSSGPSRLRSPNVRSDGLVHARDGVKPARGREWQCPPRGERRGVPASQNDMPLPVVCAPPTVVVTAGVC